MDFFMLLLLLLLIQLLCLAEQIKFCDHIEAAISQVSCTDKDENGKVSYRSFHPKPRPHRSCTLTVDEKKPFVPIHPLPVMNTAHRKHPFSFCGQGNAGGLLPPLRQLLEQYTAYDLSSQPLMQLKVKALVLDLVHSMDVVNQLQK